jgi:hypothetical protein
MEPWDALRALANVGRMAGEVSLVYSEHVLGMTGQARWLIVESNGDVTERTMSMGGAPQSSRVGRLPPGELHALAALLVAQRLDELARNAAAADPQGTPNRRTRVSVSAGGAELEVDLSTPTAAARPDMQAIKAAFERAREVAIGWPGPSPPLAPRTAPLTASAAATSASGGSGTAGGGGSYRWILLAQTVVGVIMLLVYAVKKLLF